MVILLQRHGNIGNMYNAMKTLYIILLHGHSQSSRHMCSLHVQLSAAFIMTTCQNFVTSLAVVTLRWQRMQDVTE